MYRKIHPRSFHPSRKSGNAETENLLYMFSATAYILYNILLYYINSRNGIVLIKIVGLSIAKQMGNMLKILIVIFHCQHSIFLLIFVLCPLIPCALYYRFQLLQTSLLPNLCTIMTRHYSSHWYKVNSTRVKSHQALDKWYVIYGIHDYVSLLILFWISKHIFKNYITISQLIYYYIFVCL